MEIMDIVLDTMRWELQTSNGETAHTNVPAVSNSDGESAHALINYGGGEDALMLNVKRRRRKGVHTLISRKTKCDRKLKHVHRSKRQRDAKKSKSQKKKKRGMNWKKNENCRVTVVRPIDVVARDNR
jgi:hypothetical protein